MPRKLSKQKLLERILSCSDMLQGSIVRINSRCGKKGCRCEQGKYHGVSHYLSYKEKGRTQMVYIPKTLVPSVNTWITDIRHFLDNGGFVIQEPRPARGSLLDSSAQS